MNNNNFISINGNIYNAAYITTIRKISDDNERAAALLTFPIIVLTSNIVHKSIGS